MGAFRFPSNRTRDHPPAHLDRELSVCLPATMGGGRRQPGGGRRPATQEATGRAAAHHIGRVRCPGGRVQQTTSPRAGSGSGHNGRSPRRIAGAGRVGCGGSLLPNHRRRQGGQETGGGAPRKDRDCSAGLYRHTARKRLVGSVVSQPSGRCDLLLFTPASRPSCLDDTSCLCLRGAVGTCRIVAASRAAPDRAALWGRRARHRWGFGEQSCPRRTSRGRLRAMADLQSAEAPGVGDRGARRQSRHKQARWILPIHK